MQAAANLLKLDAEAGFSEVISEQLGVDERCYAILKDQTVVGFISYRHTPNQLQHFFIGIEWRRRGIGTRAVQIFLEQLRLLKVQSVIMSWVPGSESFWFQALKVYPRRSEQGCQLISLS